MSPAMSDENIKLTHFISHELCKKVLSISPIYLSYTLNNSIIAMNKDGVVLILELLQYLIGHTSWYRKMPCSLY